MINVLEKNTDIPPDNRKIMTSTYDVTRDKTAI